MVFSIMAEVVVDFVRQEHSQLTEIIFVDVSPSNISLIKKAVQEKLAMMYSATSRPGPSKHTAASDPIWHSTASSRSDFSVRGASDHHVPTGTFVTHSTLPPDGGARPKYSPPSQKESQPWPPTAVSYDNPIYPEPSPSGATYSGIYPSLSGTGDDDSTHSTFAGTGHSLDASTSSASAPATATNAADDDGDVGDQCPICMDAFTSPKTLKCDHKFCSECIDSAFAHKSVCPICGEVYGVLKGNQPEGNISVSNDYAAQLPGYSQAGVIIIEYHFKDGVQGVSMICLYLLFICTILSHFLAHVPISECVPLSLNIGAWTLTVICII